MSTARLPVGRGIGWGRSPSEQIWIGLREGPKCLTVGQWWIQGVHQPKRGIANLLFSNIFGEYAWKWKKLDWKGGMHP